MLCEQNKDALLFLFPNVLAAGGDVSELALTFTITVAVPGGGHVEVELKPGGRNIAVTNDNVMEYIHRVADYRWALW